MRVPGMAAYGSHYRCGCCKSIYSAEAIQDGDSAIGRNKCPVCFAYDWKDVHPNTIQRLRIKAKLPTVYLSFCL